MGEYRTTLSTFTNRAHRGPVTDPSNWYWENVDMTLCLCVEGDRVTATLYDQVDNPQERVSPHNPFSGEFDESLRAATWDFGPLAKIEDFLAGETREDGSRRLPLTLEEQDYLEVLNELSEFDGFWIQENAVDSVQAEHAALEARVQTDGKNFTYRPVKDGYLLREFVYIPVPEAKRSQVCDVLFRTTRVEASYIAQQLRKQLVSL
jgi:hypothetical protein